MKRTWVLLMLAGCGSVSDKPDAPVASDTLVDTPEDVPMDAMLGAWGTPMKIAELASGAADWGPTLRADQLEIFFSSGRGNGVDDIYSSTRVSTSGLWAAPQLVGTLNSAAFDLQPSLSSDGLTIWLASNRNNASFEILASTRATLSGAWSPPAPIAELNSTNDEAPENLLANGMTMAFSSNRTGNYEIYFATRAGATGAFTSTALAMGVNTAGDEFDAHLTEDGTTLYYTSPGASSLDLFVARRAGTTGAFANPTPMSELFATTATNEEDAWVSADQRTIIFVSDRDGNRDLWQATR